MTSRTLTYTHHPATSALLIHHTPHAEQPQARFGLVGLPDSALPRIKLFKKGADTAKPVDYGGPMKDSAELLAWTVEQTGVFVGVKVRGVVVVVVAA